MPSNRPQPSDKALAELNSQWFVARDGGQTLVFEWADDQFSDPLWPRMVLQGYHFEAFRNWERNKRVVEGGEIVARGPWWLSHPSRREYSAIRMMPEKGARNPSVYNLWQGFSTNARAGNWTPFREFLLQTICSNNQQTFHWLLSWMAEGISQPTSQGSAILVLRGRNQAAKDVFGRLYGELFGQHFVSISDSRRISYRTNNRYRDGVVLLVSDPKRSMNEKIIRTLIKLASHPTIEFEIHGGETVHVPNNLHLIVSFAEQWEPPLRAEQEFAIIDVPGDFDIMHKDLDRMVNLMREGGGHSALLHDLLHYDTGIPQIDSRPGRAAPVVEAAHLGLIDRWWFECLWRGRLIGMSATLPDLGRAWPKSDEPIDRDDLYAAFSWYAREVADSNARPSKQNVWSHMRRKLHCDLVDPKRVSHTAIREWLLPPLAQARAGFLDAHPLQLDWPNGDAVEKVIS